MTSQIVKVGGGETIHVRTGLISGIGPQGPTGPTGPQGPQGDQGPQGEPGPMGQINSFSSVSDLQANNLTAGQTKLMTWTVVRDELGMATSSTRWTAPEYYDLVVVGFITFAKPAGTATGHRAVEVRHITSGGAPSVVLAKQQNDAVGLGDTGITFAATGRFFTGDYLEIWAVNGDSTQITASAGKIHIYRVGSGPVGPQGPQGIQGIQGPIGEQGIQGPAGNANSGFLTYESLRPA